MPYSQLSRSSINRALRRLAGLLATHSLRLDFALCHGRVFYVAYTTVQGLFESSRFVVPSSEVAAIIARVAPERGLASDWVAQDLKFYLALGAARSRSPLADFEPRLGLLNVAPPHLLALKLQACQAAATPSRIDLDDAIFLIKRMRLLSAAEVERVFVLHFGGCRLDSSVRATIARQAFEGSPDGGTYAA